MKALIERGLQYAGGILRRQQITYPARNRFWLSTQSPSPLLPPRPLPLPPPPPPPHTTTTTTATATTTTTNIHPPPPPPPHIQPQQFQFPFFQSQHLSQYPMQQSWFPSIFNTVHSNGKGAGTAIYQSNGEISKNSGGSGTGGSSQHSKKKVKRKAEPPVLGIRYTISCVRHGEIDDDNMLTLCGTCWTWRKLPPDYFPPLINELVCSKENQGHCLSGWGKCQQKYRNFDVLRNVNGNWQPTTISTATCCDCRIRAGTEIHPLVIGKRQN
ncbi:Uncharacterized protein BM_BM8482 [Brugia malayi]|uniref:Uncharacterized protein n=1 Tax=Brugia malayi TaxID=6279 RepID=A0A4E9F1U6_BRUMA|nr:Uncharacterized protein BM_BM8482 [Brugia malayi]VIO90007.1 Uncharacterized protein BM_BM8482 [Brugia malayi]